MLKELIHYIIDLSTPETVEVDGYNYSDRDLKIVLPPKPECMEFKKLESFVSYCKIFDHKTYFIYGNKNTLYLAKKGLTANIRHDIYAKFCAEEALKEAGVELSSVIGKIRMTLNNWLIVY